MRTRSAITAALLAATAIGCQPVDPTVKETPIIVISEEPGFGRTAREGDLVTVKYKMFLPDGTEVLRDREYVFELGAGTVIAAMEDAVLGMKLRGRRVVDCPPHKHWGRQGYGNGAIPPDTHLTLDVELLEVDTL